MRGRSTAAVVVAGLLALGACSGGSPAQPSDPVSTRSTPTPTPTAMITPRAEDVVYQDPASTDNLNPVLDVWALPRGDGRPVVVMFHGGVGNLDKGYLAPLAGMVAARGAVVFVPNLWPSLGIDQDVEQALAAGRTWRDGAACAVAYAVAHAGEYGGDPNTLVIFGHSSGGLMAPTTAARGTLDCQGCAVEPTAFDVDGLVAWDGDPLLAGDTDIDERLPNDIPQVMAEVTPWRWLATGKRFNVDLVTGEQAARGMVRQVPDESGDWLARRDPTGVFRQELESLGALKDSAVGLSEEADLLAARMSALSYNVRRITLPDAGHEWEETNNQARELLVQSILTVATR